MARPTKPTALKVIQGTQRKDRANPAEPKPEVLADDSPAPEWLSPRGKEAWGDLLPLLRSMKVATTVDPAAFAMLCDALAEYIDAREVVIREGATYWTRGKVEMLRSRPEVTIASEAWRRAKMMLTEFGLTPASRSKVSATVEGAQDPLEKWANG
jgi:P27 family predicted phage terminase small subunit